MSTLLETINALLAGPSPETGSKTLRRIERTLTDGYASALALEGERLRIERAIEDVTASIDGAGAGQGAAELSRLTRRRASIDQDLTHLRDRLGLLRDRIREARTALPQTQAT